jgi:hypothetical protein
VGNRPRTAETREIFRSYGTPDGLSSNPRTGSPHPLSAALYPLF